MAHILQGHVSRLTVHPLTVRWHLLEGAAGEG